jgi:hypothetical protein
LRRYFEQVATAPVSVVDHEFHVEFMELSSTESDYLPYRHAAGPDLEIPIANFTNIPNIDESGTVTNTDAAHRRAAQWIQASCDPTYQMDPPLQSWETELT